RHATTDDQLSAHVALRLEKHGIHINCRLRPASARLQGLGAPDLTAARRHGGVVRHVLRLEGTNCQAAREEHAAKTGHHPGLTYVRAAALNHQRSSHVASAVIPTTAATPITIATASHNSPQANT